LGCPKRRSSDSSSSVSSTWHQKSSAETKIRSLWLISSQTLWRKWCLSNSTRHLTTINWDSCSPEHSLMLEKCQTKNTIGYHRRYEWIENHRAQIQLIRVAKRKPKSKCYLQNLIRSWSEIKNSWRRTKAIRYLAWTTLAIAMDHFIVQTANMKIPTSILYRIRMTETEITTAKPTISINKS